MNKWTKCVDKKPEEKYFWALIDGRNEQGIFDFQIIILENDIEFNSDYRSLDGTSSYHLPNTANCRWYTKILAWKPLGQDYDEFVKFCRED